MPCADRSRPSTALSRAAAKRRSRHHRRHDIPLRGGCAAAAQTPYEAVSVGRHGLQGNGISLLPPCPRAASPWPSNSGQQSRLPGYKSRERRFCLRYNGRTTRVSVSTAGHQSNGESVCQDLGPRPLRRLLFFCKQPVPATAMPLSTSSSITRLILPPVSVASNNAGDSDSLFPPSHARYVAFDSRQQPSPYQTDRHLPGTTVHNHQMRSPARTKNIPAHRLPQPVVPSSPSPPTSARRLNAGRHLGDLQNH